ncbi:MAG: polysulfide reductase NrfD [Desulfovibrio sp.]|jgi:Ni/Fe-hydrogenase subunit HybB-like protein|nr:polysulfide reductase NrfD [Desulfovibrio sp.]
MNSEGGSRTGRKNHIKSGILLFILIAGFGVTLLRFTSGLGGVTNLDDRNPWGFWVTFDLLCGIALSAGGFAVTAACYIFGFKQFHVYVRAALTTAFLGYFFEVVALVYEVGQPWRLLYPFFLSRGTSSVLFPVGLCVVLYLGVLFVELLPALPERPGRGGARDKAVLRTVPAAVIGAVIAVIHQSSLGTLYLIVPSKIHPLWYSRFMPLFFLISSVFAGLSMVVAEGCAAHKFLSAYTDDQHAHAADKALLSCGKAASLFLLVYLILKLIETAVSNKLHYLFSGYGAWFFLELAAGVALPAFMFLVGVRRGHTRLIQAASIITVLGVVLNRFNVSLVAFNYNLPSSERYFPSWMEIAVSVFLMTLLIIAYRRICCELPILRMREDCMAEDNTQTLPE